MLEDGLVNLVNSDPTVQTLTGGIGGFSFDDLPQNLPLPTWSFRLFGGQSLPFLQGSKGIHWQRLEISCYSNAPQAALVMRLANAIDNVLEGFSGMLPDASPGQTYLDSCFSSNSPIDFFDGLNRTFRRVLEYRIWVL